MNYYRVSPLSLLNKEDLGAVGASWHCTWGGQTLIHLLIGSQQLQYFWKEV